MSKYDSLPKTRQGVRNLNSLGAQASQQWKSRSWTCPPHLPADHWEYDEWHLTWMRRCRACKIVIDTEAVDW